MSLYRDPGADREQRAKKGEIDAAHLILDESAAPVVTRYFPPDVVAPVNTCTRDARGDSPEVGGREKEHRLAVDLLRVGWRFRRRGWYGHPPFVPLPPLAYVQWRMYTAYGDESATPPARDVERYARWVGKHSG